MMPENKAAETAARLRSGFKMDDLGGEVTVCG